MTYDAQRFWTKCYGYIPPDHERGASSTQRTKEIFGGLDQFFTKHSITSMFDAGCNDALWIKNNHLRVKYQGGDISITAIKRARTVTDLDVRVHDITRDPIPACDLLWIRDVMIHLSDADRKRVLINWVHSGIPWLMMTQIDGVINQDIEYSMDLFQTTETNWYAQPWLFPQGQDCIYEMGTRKMELWHRDQIKDLPCIE